MSGSESPKMITLKSSDGENFELEEAVALESQTIKHMIEDGCADAPIPLPNVTSKILAKVIEYCKRHVEAAAKPDADKPAEEDLKTFDQDFVKVDQTTLFDLILVMRGVNGISFGEDEAVDDKADDFINRFRQQLKLQRIESFLNYRGTTK